jgi:hypothetical protein
MNTHPLVSLPPPGTLIIGGHVTDMHRMLSILRRQFVLPNNPWRGHTPGLPLSLSLPFDENTPVHIDTVCAMANAAENCGGGLAWSSPTEYKSARSIVDFYWPTPGKTYDVAIVKELTDCPDYQGFCAFMNTPHIVETMHKTIELTN